MPGIQTQYLGMPLQLADLDGENLEYFRHCAAHDFHLQACAGCGRARQSCARPPSGVAAIESL